MPSITIITPCYNENTTLISFLDQFGETLKDLNQEFVVVVINDASNDNTEELLRAYKFDQKNISLDIVNLRFNVGHQRAIFQGFLYVQKSESQYYIVMDSDGEDNPNAIPLLLDQLDNHTDIVHVVRGKRSESLSFKIFYQLYKLIFRLITNQKMNYGNYCLIKKTVVDKAIFSGFTHFPAFLSKQKLYKKSITFDRSKRISGTSKMNFTRLFYHAFYSLVEYSDALLMMFVKIFLWIMLLFTLALGNVLYQKFVIHTAVLGWASNIIIGLFNTALIAIGFFTIGVLLTNIQNNNNQNLQKPIYDQED